MDPDAKIGPSQSKARRRTAEIGPLKSKAQLHTSTTDYSDLNSIQEQLTASTQRMEELHKTVTESSRPSHKANFACYIKGEILNMTDIQFIRAKPRFLDILKKLERESETPPISTGEQYVCEVPDLRSIPVCHPPCVYQPPQSQYCQAQVVAPHQQQRRSAAHMITSAAVTPLPLGPMAPRSTPSPIVASSPLPVAGVYNDITLALAKTSRILSSSDVSLGCMSMSEFQGCGETDVANYEDAV